MKRQQVWGIVAVAAGAGALALMYLGRESGGAPPPRSPWFLAPLALMLVAIVGNFLAAWYGVRDGRRGRPGRCRACDYDLAGNVSGVCPECGASAGPRGGRGEEGP